MFSVVSVRHSVRGGGRSYVTITRYPQFAIYVFLLKNRKKSLCHQIYWANVESNDLTIHTSNPTKDIKGY